MTTLLAVLAAVGWVFAIFGWLSAYMTVKHSAEIIRTEVKRRTGESDG